MLPRIVDGSQELCGSDTAAIFIRDPETDAMVPRYRVGPALSAYRTLRITRGRGLGGVVMQTGHAARTNDYLRDPRVPADFHAVADETGTVTLMVVPITIQGQVEGLLYISNNTARPFSDEDEAICLRLADQAAVAIQNARLFLSERAVRADAEAANRAKDEFLAVLAHELRTPLTAILGWAFFRTSSTGFGRPTAPAEDCMAASGSGWRSHVNWPNCTEGASRRRAPVKDRARRSRCACRSCATSRLCCGCGPSPRAPGWGARTRPPSSASGSSLSTTMRTRAICCPPCSRDAAAR